MDSLMIFYAKAESKEFWENVRTNPDYRFLVEELLDLYKTCATKELTDISYELYMEYYRSGNRFVFDEEYYLPRRLRLSVCALLSLIYPEEEAYFRNLMNTIWAVCNEYSWALPAHIPSGETEYDPYYIDLFAAETASALSEIRHFLGDRMGKLMKERIHREIQTRIVRSFLENTFQWESRQNNWAAVCASNIACTFLYENPDLFWQIKPRIDKILDCFFAGYNADGVCREGLAYWQYGFGYYVNYAQRLLEYTRGRVNLFKNERVKQIAQFPDKVFLERQVIASFSDSGRSGAVGMGTMNVLRAHYGDIIPILPRESYYQYCRTGRFMLHIDSIIWFEPEAEQTKLPEDVTYYMKESAWFIKKGTRYSFAAKGGHNAEPHNHNDLGSFIFCHGGRQILVDLGAGEYNRDYFGPKRYEILCNRSAGHSVPILDGCEQAAGEDYCSSMDFADDILTIDITGAYPQNRIRKAVRTFSFGEKGVRLKDIFMYDPTVECSQAVTERQENTGSEHGRGAYAGLVRERFVTLMNPKVMEGIIQLEEVSLKFDATLWRAEVSEGVHRENAKKATSVYFIDFVNKTSATAFQLEIYAAGNCGICGEKGE